MIQTLIKQTDTAYIVADTAMKKMTDTARKFESTDTVRKSESKNFATQSYNTKLQTYDKLYSLIKLHNEEIKYDFIIHIDFTCLYRKRKLLMPVLRKTLLFSLFRSFIPKKEAQSMEFQIRRPMYLNHIFDISL